MLQRRRQRRPSFSAIVCLLSSVRGLFAASPLYFPRLSRTGLPSYVYVQRLEKSSRQSKPRVASSFSVALQLVGCPWAMPYTFRLRILHLLIHGGKCICSSCASESFSCIIRGEMPRCTRVTYYYDCHPCMLTLDSCPRVRVLTYERTSPVWRCVLCACMLLGPVSHGIWRLPRRKCNGKQ